MPPREGTADFTDFEQIKGVLAHAGRTKKAWKFRGVEAWLFAAYAALAQRPACRALAARSVAVEGLALRACTLRSLFSGAAQAAPCAQALALLRVFVEISRAAR